MLVLNMCVNYSWCAVIREERGAWSVLQSEVRREAEDALAAKVHEAVVSDLPLDQVSLSEGSPADGTFLKLRSAGARSSLPEHPEARKRDRRQQNQEEHGENGHGHGSLPGGYAPIPLL